ncbi:MAG: DUF1569 domain-containing protein [Bryobacteraceae bacterium]
MAKSLWNPADRESLLARFDSLKPDQRPQWGEMSASKMLRHCTLPLLSTMGEFPVKPKNTLFRYWPFQPLVIYLLPWPKGAPTAPEFIITDEGDFNDRRAALRAAIDKFASRGESQTFQPHAAFGPLNPKDWGALAYRHLDHHLKQFGV